jgi:hypothetical protein
MMFNPKHRKVIQRIWAGLAILIIGSMVVFSFPALWQ